MSRLIFTIALAAVLAMYFVHREADGGREARDRGQVAKRVQDGQSFGGPHVNITGKVVGVAAMFGRGAYWVQTANGSRTLIVSSTGVPPLNSVITVSGTVHQAAVLNNERFDLVVQSN